ncbi:hypothetical protein [Microbacterium sp. K5D]|uniref:hypothetical protein n=1 Tax=Microbacterium sp. K5D TaxID=2305436 RepID=UPI00109CAD2F|nr:hypothetical protein [Microbacterium sp. K5D]
MTFTASNGAIVHNPTKGGIAVGNSLILRDNESTALREFFQHESDEARGLWRSPSDPTWTAVRRNTMIYFQNEDHERSFHFVPKLEGSIRAWSGDLQALAYEYIEAHPERKPWEEAKPGEVWLFRGKGDIKPSAFMKSHVGWTNSEAVVVQRDPALPYGGTRDESFEPRRIWPEDAS